MKRKKHINSEDITSDSFDINNQDFKTSICWCKDIFTDYHKLGNEYMKCSEIIFRNIIDNCRDNGKIDSWIFPAIFFARQSIELKLKSLICRVYTKKSDIQQIFLNNKHNLNGLLATYLQKNEDFINKEEKQWLTDYLNSLETVDAKSDIFRFNFDDLFLERYRDKFLDIVDVGNNMIQADSIINKCINKGEYESGDDFDSTLLPDFFIFANHGIGNCYLWQSISDDGFEKKISGYSEVSHFLLYECKDIPLQQKIYPLIFSLRQAIELCLKSIFYISLDYGVPEHKFNAKRNSHLLRKDLWRNVKPTIQYYAEESSYDLNIIDIVENLIIEINLFDKNGDTFRYPTTYSFEYRYNNIEIDLENIFEHMYVIADFLNGCYWWLKGISDYEKENLDYNYREY